MNLVLSRDRDSDVNWYRGIEMVCKNSGFCWEVKCVGNWKGEIEVVNREKIL